MDGTRCQHPLQQEQQSLLSILCVAQFPCSKHLSSCVSAAAGSLALVVYDADWELERFEINMVPPMDVTVTLEPGLTFLRSAQGVGAQHRGSICRRRSARQDR